ESCFLTQPLAAELYALALHDALPILLKRALAGRIRFGVIPAALPTVSLLTGPFWQQHPAVTLHVISLSSKEIQRGLDSFDLDLGFTSPETEPLSRLKLLPPYPNRFAFISIPKRDAA